MRGHVYILLVWQKMEKNTRCIGEPIRKEFLHDVNMTSRYKCVFFRDVTDTRAIITK